MKLTRIDKTACLHCILMGNPADGFVVIGPFEDFDAAQAYLESEPSNAENMWIVEMNLPAGEE